jgi:hypothetical protein
MWWNILKGQEYHPSVQGYLKDPKATEDSAKINPETGEEIVIPAQVERTKFIGQLPKAFWARGYKKGHAPLVDKNRLEKPNEQNEVRDRITEALRPYLDKDGKYHPDSPRSYAIRTHVFEENRQPDQSYSKSNGDSIVGIVRTMEGDSDTPQLHTVMLRRSEFNKSPQPFRADAMDVEKVIRREGLSKKQRNARKKARDKKYGKRRW